MGRKLNKLNLVFFLIFAFNINLHAEKTSMIIEQDRVIALVKKAATSIEENGKKKAIAEFRKDSSRIFAIDFNGMVLASPLHPETVGTNQINFKDPSGALVVQEEIEKAKVGGGWLKGRYRQNSQTGHYECRRLYIFPIVGNYFIGSWYYYPASQQGKCLV